MTNKYRKERRGGLASIDKDEVVKTIQTIIIVIFFVGVTYIMEGH